MQQNRNSKNTSRMASAVSMAKAQPARGNVAQPSRTAGGNGSSARTFNGQVDPQWQQKLSGGSRFPPSSVFRPSSVATNNNGQRSDSNFTSSSIGNANRRRPGQQNGGFDAKLFLRQQQKGQYLHAASAGVSPAPAPTTNTANGAKKTQSTTAQPWQQPAARQFTPSMDPKAFDIEQFKAMQPRRALLAPNSAMQQQQQQQQSTTMQQQQQQQQQQALQQRSRQQQVQSTALSVERQTNATDNDDDDNDTAADEPTAALPWQTAKQNLDARPAKATTSKEILQQMAAMRGNATPALGTTQASNVSVLPDGAVLNTDVEQQN